MTVAVVRQLGAHSFALRFQGRDLRCALGAGGISPLKQEGDGATPSGTHSLRRLLYRADRRPPPACGSLPREPIAPEDGWCDDPDHADYNRMVRLPHPGRHENLWREDGLYDLLAPLAYNDDPVQRGRGSAIFLHVAHPDLRPTQGCVALLDADLAWVLANGLAAIDIPRN
ncbi:L,D-transpeptidase family protein [Lichenicoccus sp.]|uniref:L,D-transpeptidase family protein n=1 Tax=Lichenicoccus sp. TaxID=2781899 RepID=UPI003D0A3582